MKNVRLREKRLRQMLIGEAVFACLDIPPEFE